MSDIDERPLKIRKLESIEEPTASSTSDVLESTAQTTISAERDNLEALNDPTNGDSNNTEATSEAQPALSKTQLKKLKKSQKWEAQKAHRTEFRRTKRRERAARKAVARADGLIPPPPPAGSRRPQQVPISFLLDCDFESYMTEKEIISLTAQVTRCYSDNRTAKYRGHMGISGWGGKMKERFETVLGGHYKGWKGVNFLEEGWVEAGKTMDQVMRGKEGGKIMGALATENGFEDLDPKIIKSKRAATTAMEGVIEENIEKPDSSETESVETIVPSTNKKEFHSLRSLGTPLPEEKIEDTADRPTSAQSELLNLSSAEPVSGTAGSVPIEPILKSQAEVSDTTTSPPKLVYLSSDSENTLTTLSPYTTYVIGGIVDKNRHKGLCYKRACEAGIPTAKLPIGEYMTIQGRTVLTVNHVMEIMIRWLETGDWGEAFVKVIPKRKEAKLRGKGADSKAEDEETEEVKSESGSEDDEEGGVSLRMNPDLEEEKVQTKSENDTIVEVKSEAVEN